MSELLVGAARRWELPEFGLPKTPVEAPKTAAEIDDIEKAAYEDGFARGRAEGEAQGYADGARRVREEVERLRAVFDHLARPLAELAPEVERTLVALALDVGRRLAQGALKDEPERVLAIVREAIASLAQPVRDARIHLHPDDAKLASESFAADAEAAAWRIVADGSLRRGDVRVLTDAAQVDARLDTREAGIARAVFGETR